ncbi:cytochrome P450 [Mucidula mucida]|nr:cytochrome P450 [Mucidula mucida]
MAVANIMMIAYGHSPDENSDDLVSMAQEVMQYLGTAMTTHKHLVDALPFLKVVPSWFPGASFQRTAAASRSTLQRFYDTPFERIVNQMKSGTHYPSLVSNVLPSDLTPEERHILKATAGEMYGAGTDTNVSVISSFFLAMVLNPEIQQRGRQEILGIIGKERLPQFSDQNSLPFVAAIVQECFRWNPSVPLGPAGHCSRKHDTYRGYHIPARTLVIANAWGLLHDEHRYVEPMRFDPDRYLRDPKPPNATDFTFGFGRRSCPGSHLAHSTVFIAIATTLATCNIAPCVNADGVAVLPDVIYTNAAFSQPYPFKCEISVVSDEAMKLLSDALK